MNAGSESSSVSPPLDDHEHQQQHEAAARVVDAGLARVVRAGLEIWYVARFLLFFLYAALAIVVFWLWVAGALLFLVRSVVSGVMTLVLWMSAGIPREPGAPPRSAGDALAYEIRRRWQRRQLVYEEMARPVARHYLATRRQWAAFWHWSPARKSLALVLAALFVGVPAVYIVPRPHYVQVIDNNAIDYDAQLSGGTRYLIHAVDMFSTGKREYLNEDMWWLGKVNSQRMKNRLQRGRFFKLWVVGLRWWKYPALYPNIIGATEVDAQGMPLEQPSQLIPATTTGH